MNQEAQDHEQQRRHRCEVRHYLARARRDGIDWLGGFVAGWKRWPDSQLKKDFWVQWKAGNRGRSGEWYEPEPEALDPEAAGKGVSGAAAPES